MHSWVTASAIEDEGRFCSCGAGVSEKLTDGDAGEGDVSRASAGGLGAVMAARAASAVRTISRLAPADWRTGSMAASRAGTGEVAGGIWGWLRRLRKPL